MLREAMSVPLSKASAPVNASISSECLASMSACSCLNSCCNFFPARFAFNFSSLISWTHEKQEHAVAQGMVGWDYELCSGDAPVYVVGAAALVFEEVRQQQALLPTLPNCMFTNFCSLCCRPLSCCDVYIEHIFGHKEEIQLYTSWLF